MKGSEFEKLILEQCRRYYKSGIAHITRYGVQAARTKEEWIILRSLPDFEGVLQDGRQLIFDAKVCSSASFSLSKYRKATRGERSRQLEHMFTRAQYNVLCFFLIHWPERKLKRGIQPAQTQLIRIAQDIDPWTDFLSGNLQSIPRDNLWGIEVPWYRPPGCRKDLPDFLSPLLNGNKINE